MKILNSVKAIIYCLLLSLVLASNAQTVTIRGQAKQAEGKTIYLYTYADQLTSTEKKLASAKIDSLGKFELNVNISETLEAFLRIEYFNAEIYIKPGKTYDVRLSPIETISNSNKKSPYFNEENISVDISSTGKNELNNIINKFRYECNDFLLKNFQTVFKNRRRSPLDSFKTGISQEFADADDNYFKDFVKYKFASFEFLSKTKSEADIENIYFNPGPVLYDNPQYMDFFNDFFTKYYTKSKFITPFDLYEAVNKNRGSYDDLMTLLRKDTLLKNEDLKELVLLKEMNDLYHTTGFIKENVLYIIQEEGFKAGSPQNKLIASNLYKLLTKLTPFTKAPGFSLKDIDGKDYSLKSLKGKYVYLSFFQTDNAANISELKVVSSLFEKYKENIEFVNICCDVEIGSLKSFIKDYKGMEGKYLYFADNWDMLNNYNIKTFPTFIFIDPDGEILNYPAPKPSEQIQLIFDKELHKN